MTRANTTLEVKTRLDPHPVDAGQRGAMRRRCLQARPSGRGMVTLLVETWR
jgi:hypothetical protein